jgi:trehalose synthase
MMPHEVEVQALDTARLDQLIGPDRATRFHMLAEQACKRLATRRVVNVNSTAKGGGVAELLQTLLAYARGVGIDTRWLVIEGNAEFFAITKRIHNAIYGSRGDGGDLGAREHSAYEAVLAGNADDLLSSIRRDDVVILHDPQTAGLVPAMKVAGAHVVWRCHIGSDLRTEHTDRGWDFVRPYLAEVDSFVFTRAQFAPPWIPDEQIHVITPSIDPFAAKNTDLAPEEQLHILQHVGLLAGQLTDPVVTSFRRRDGSPGRVDRAVDILQTGPPPPPDVPLVAQVSRWDRMKDMRGVLEAFAHHVSRRHGAHLALVGPTVHGVTDDPEAAAVLDECIETWRALPAAIRARVHLACIPLHDPDEAAIITNALQRHATVVTQKSLAEGFGLTVVEAMWKRRPVVGTRVGGIADQIDDGVEGLLIDDPHDLPAFGDAVDRLLGAADLRAAMGERAHDRAHRDFLADRHLEQFAGVIDGLVPV